MATYAELHDLFTHDSVLQVKVRVAAMVAARAIFDEAPATANHANRLIWARDALMAPRAKGDELLPVLLATHRGLPVDQIESATDAAVQSAVDSIIDLFATGVV